MNDKCNKFESLFIFSNEKTLKEHVLACPECRKEYEKMNRVSDLIKEVKPESKKPANVGVKSAWAWFLCVIGGVSIQMLDLQYGFLDTIKYGSPLTIEELGLPTDDYGLIQVD